MSTSGGFRRLAVGAMQTGCDASAITKKKPDQKGNHLTTNRSFVLMMLFSHCVIASALAESGSITGTVNGGASSPAETPIAVTRLVLPDEPVHNAPNTRVIDKKFIMLMAALGGAESLRFTTHKLVLDNEFAAGAPWVMNVPRNQHLVAKYAALYAAELLVVYEMKKPHSWLPGDRMIRTLWWAGPATLIPIDIKNGVRSMRTQPPAGAGCSSVAQCEALMQ